MTSSWYVDLGCDKIYYWSIKGLLVSYKSISHPISLISGNFLPSTSQRTISVSNKIFYYKTHWGRVTHICFGKPTITGSDNGLSPGRPQAIIWTNAEMLLIWPLGTYFSEMLSEIQTFSLKKIRLKMSSVKCCPFHLCHNVLRSL